MERLAPEELGKLPLFRRLTPEMRARIVAVAHVRTYERGDVIFSEGDAPDIFVTVLTGHVKVFKQTPAGKDVILDLFGPGDPLGGVAVYEGRAYPASAARWSRPLCLSSARRSSDCSNNIHHRARFAHGLTLRMVELTNRPSDLTGGHVTRASRGCF
jgi:hypothetical protein